MAPFIAGLIVGVLLVLLWDELGDQFDRFGF